MNNEAISPQLDPTAWEALLVRGRDQGTVTQEEVCEVLAFDADRLDADLDWVRAELKSHDIILDESLVELIGPEPITADEQAELDSTAHVEAVLADPLGGIDLAGDDMLPGPRKRLRLVNASKGGDRGASTTSDPVRVYLKEIGRVALLFSDLKGSTALYDAVGDAAAYRLVRAHFAYLAAIVREHDGAVVKTIGDAVMAAFHDPVQALRAALPK